MAALLAVLLAPAAAPGSVVAAPRRDPGRDAASDLAGLGQGTDEGAPEPQAQPSIHYEQALEHASDVLEFEPGARVAVPFTPRGDDTWTVDGHAPRGLPAGHATGAELRAAPEASIWAAGRPAGLAVDSNPPGEDALAPVDQPSTSAGAIADPAAVSGPTSGGTTLAAPVGTNGLRREVFGFLPYWELGDSSTTLDWRTLSTVAYFSVGCNSNGTLAKLDPDGTLSTGWAGWTSSKMTSVINAAHEHQTRVVLTISCFAWNGSGASRQAALLGSSTARATLAKAAAAAVRDRGADGINLDFEPIVAGYADEFTALVRRIRTELNNVAPGYQLTFDTLGSIGNQPIAEATAAGGADAVFIMGYDYRTDGSSVAGSISPLTGPRYDLTDTVKAYLAKVPASKVILGVPYYGRAWSTASDKLNASTLNPAKYGSPASPTYTQALAFAGDYGRRYDKVEQAPWTAYRKQTCTSTYGCITSWRELYYDDAASLKLRYDLVNRQALRGAGIWALGYDGTRTELRNALADKFLADRTPPLTGISILAQTQRDEGFRVAWAAWDDSTIIGFDIDVAVDGGAWTRWLTATKLTSSIYLGTDGRTYAFRARGTDAHGNVSAWNASILPGVTSVPDALAVGGFGVVVTDGLRMRSGPSIDASVMVTLADGSALHLIGGPVSADGYTWWQVEGPIRQWGQVDPMQVGGWVAGSGGGATNVAPRRPAYATLVDAGMSGLVLADGGQRVLTPNGDADADKLHLEWTNHGDFEGMRLRIFRTDGSVVGDQAIGATADGPRSYWWDGTLDGVSVPAGTYVVQLEGTRNGNTLSAPSSSPVSPAQIARYGVVLGPATPTGVTAFVSTPVSPTRASSLTFHVTFGGLVTGLTRADFTRSGTATGCVLGAVTGTGASWAVSLTSCGVGTVILTLKAKAVTDAVANLGPTTAVAGPKVVIDRTAPGTTAPRVALVAGGALASSGTKAALAATVIWSGVDRGGAGIRDYDVRRSIDGGAFTSIAVDMSATQLATAITPGHSYRFEVRARDRAGNVGGWVAGPVLRGYLLQQSSTALTWHGTWTRTSGASLSGLTARSAAAQGASVKYAFGGRAIAVVATRGPTRGAMKVYLDGVYVTTIDTWAAAPAPRAVVFSRSWGYSGWHTIRLVVVGTVGRPGVEFDALEVLR